ncbi:glycoside hydrolase [Ganoderma leucocontextum]|nr:glycoside hydrolase [Ganoderma leucocontextum]
MPPPWDAHPPGPLLRRRTDLLNFATPTALLVVAETQTKTVTWTPSPAPSDPSEAILFLPPAAPLPVSSTAPTRPPDSFLPSNATPAASANPNQIPPVSPLPLDAHFDPNANANANPNPSSPPPGPTSTPSSASAQGPLVMAYYPDWVERDYPPENIDFSRFDWIDFAFAVPDQNMALNWDGSDDAPDLLTRLVSRAHASGKHVKLSVGGWTGSKYFSSAVATAENREALANNLLALYSQHNLDGIDLDWEYPGQDGENGNGVSPSDSANFLEFFRLLRTTLPPEAKITAATQTVPFAGPDGNPIRDLSDFARVLDWVLLMNYDTWGSSSEPGPNAPLSDACNNSTQPNANALSALRAWTAAGFSPSQLVLGVPSYGYLSRSSATHLQTRALRSSPRILDSGPGSGLSALHRRREIRTRRRREGLLGMLIGGSNVVVNEDGGTDDGQVQFRELVRQGALQAYDSGSSSSGAPGTDPSSANGGANGNADAGGRTPAYNGSFSGPDAARLRADIENREPRRLFAGANGFVREWDECSSTPFLRSEAARQVVTYDDPVSLEMKGQLVRQAGMLGVNMFDIHGDTDRWDLTDAVRRGLGLQ